MAFLREEYTFAEGEFEKFKQAIVGQSFRVKIITTPEYIITPTSANPAQRINSMNSSLLVFLPEDSKARFLKGVYEPNKGESARPEAKADQVTAYGFKTYDQTIKKGDIVVVPTDTRFGFTTFKIVDDECEPDFDSSVEYKWIAGTVDLAGYKAILETEAKAIKLMNEAEKLAKRREVRKKMEELQNDKLSTAMAALSHAPSDTPAITNQTVVNEDPA